jgi:hypothetical protein
MNKIINKLKKMNDDKPNWENWTIEEKKQLLELYLIISKKESYIFDLIYSYHGTDGWEDIFRDYNERYLEEKTTGVEFALNGINEVS